MRSRISWLAGIAGLAFAACSPAPQEPSAQASSATLETPATPAIETSADPAPPVADTATSDAAPPASKPSPDAAAAQPIDLRYLIGDVIPAQDRQFSRVPSRLTGREGLYGQKDAVESLSRMAEAARADGVNLKVVSAFRSLDDQKRIWNNKWTGQTLVEGGRLPETIKDPAKRAVKILEYSAMPSASRHHWGTDFDLNSLDNRWFETGEGEQVLAWLRSHAANYGFCQVYSARSDQRPSGHNEERWHWSYMPVSKQMLSAYLATVTYADIAGFEGASSASAIDIIGKYVKGIDPQCLAM